MVLLIKNKVASLDDVVHLSPSPSARLAKPSMQSLRNAGVPKAMSLPQIDLLAEARSLKAYCAAVLNADLHKLKPRELIVRRVKSTKEDLRQLFDSASPKHHVELPKPSSDSIPTELASPTTAPNVGTSSSLHSSCSLAVSVPAPLVEKDEDIEDLIKCLTAAAQSWLNFAQLFPRRRASSDQTVDEARHDFCEALVQSFSDRSPTASPLQVPRSSSNLADSPSFHPICPSPVSPAPSTTTWTNQTTLTFPPVESTVRERHPQSPEFSDEDLQREFDNFSFHSSQDEEWTSDVESRKQNVFNRALSDMKRELAVPVPRLSSYFSDDSLADSAAHQTLVNPQPTCPGVSSRDDDTGSSYSADQEDESFSLSVTPPDSPVCTARQLDNAVDIPFSPAQVSLSSQMDDPTSDREQHDTKPIAGDLENGTENVWEVLATYVPRLLTRISEESLADEYEIEATAPPPLSFRRPTSQYRKFLWSRHQRTSTLDHTNQVDFTPTALLAEVTESSEGASSGARTIFATTTDAENGSGSSSVVKTLRRVRKSVDLKNLVDLPTVQSTSSIETICDTISLRKEACPPEPPVRRVRRISRCLDLRMAFGRADKNLEGREVHPVSPRRHAPARKDSAKPPIPPKPSSLCSGCDPSPSLALWSCAKITRSKGKRGRPLGESTRALKKRLDSIGIDPETMHGHSSLRSREELPPIPSISESRKPKTLKIGKLAKTRSKANAVENVEKLKISKNKNAMCALRPLPCKDQVVILVESEPTVM